MSDYAAQIEAISRATDELMPVMEALRGVADRYGLTGRHGITIKSIVDRDDDGTRVYSVSVTLDDERLKP